MLTHLRRAFALLAAVVLSLGAMAPVFAIEGETEPPAESPVDFLDSGAVPAPLVERSGELLFFLSLDMTQEPWDLLPPGLSAILISIPEDTATIYAEYSFDGETFTRLEKSWEKKDINSNVLNKMLFAVDEEPLASFLSGEESRLIVQMQLVREDGSEIATMRDEIVRPDTRPAPVLDLEIRESGDAPGLYCTFDYIPENTISIMTFYSFGGGALHAVEDILDLDGVEDGSVKLTQLCMPLDAPPLVAYLQKKVNTLCVEIRIERMNADTIYIEPITFTHGESFPIPETPPPFTATVRYGSGEAYEVYGTFTDFPPDVRYVRPEYSLDGQTYHAAPTDRSGEWSLEYLGSKDEKQRTLLENQHCFAHNTEPFKSYLAKKIDRFYTRLEIVTESGTYYTQGAVIERKDTESTPENATITAMFAFALQPLDSYGEPLKSPYGQLQLTVREDITAEELDKLLPKTLPIEVQFLRPDGKLLESGVVNIPASWNAFELPALTAGQSVSIANAADLSVPAGTQVSTPMGNYRLAEAPAFPNSELRILLDVLAADEKPDVSLQRNFYDNAQADIGALSVAFRKKPSGATAIKAYAYVDEDAEKTEIGDLLSLRALNHNGSAGLYGYVTLLQPEQAPFSTYLSKEIPGFYIGLEIEGGLFDGETLALPWPGKYDPPPFIPDPDGSQGNGNNAGADGDSDGDSNDSGQRPDLPQEPSPEPPESPNSPDSARPGYQTPSDSSADAQVSGTVSRLAGRAAQTPDTEPSPPVMATLEETAFAESTDTPPETTNHTPPEPTREMTRELSQNASPEGALERPNDGAPETTQTLADAQTIAQQAERQQGKGFSRTAAAVLVIGGGIAVSGMAGAIGAAHAVGAAAVNGIPRGKSIGKLFATLRKRLFGR